MNPSGRPGRVLVSDVDGTLCFHEEIHGMRAVPGAGTDGNPTESFLVEETATGRKFAARDVSTSSYRIYVAEETLRLMRELRRFFTIVLITGGRPSTMRKRRPILDFADAVILENGGLIYDARYEPDPGWWAHLEPERRHLAEAARQIEAAGWRLDAEGRTSALRVRLRDNPQRSSEEFSTLCRTLDLPPALAKTKNLDNLDIILAKAGKANALRYWLDAAGHGPQDAVGIGDDVNDIDFLELLGQRHVLGSAYPETLDVARARGWSIAPEGGISGINGILRCLLAEPAAT